MIKLLLRLCVGGSILLSLPIVLWYLNWQWAIPSDHLFNQWLFWITETATTWNALITSAILWLILILKLPHFSWRGILMTGVLISCILISGQLIKVIIKNVVQAPRPFVVMLYTHNAADITKFYQSSREERHALVDEQLAQFSQHQVQEIPSWLVGHWENETGYAFPSGHTLFSTSWALFAFALLSLRKNWHLLAIFSTWSYLMAGSRLALGMHSLSDVFVSTIISLILVSIFCIAAHRSQWRKWIWNTN